MLSGTDSFAFRQNSTHGGQPIAQFYWSTKACTFHGDCAIPISYNKSSIGNWISNRYTDVYITTDIDSLIATINISKCYNKTEIDDIDNELSTLILNKYNKH